MPTMAELFIVQHSERSLFTYSIAGLSSRADLGLLVGRIVEV